jgi:putative restriction endonuclease
MKAYVGVTDSDWWRFLELHPHITEVNFWQPGGNRDFRVLDRGEPFLFKSKWSDGNRLVGGGFFEGSVRLKISEAWNIFGFGNGVGSLDEMRLRVGQYRKTPIQIGEDPEVGCILLNDVRIMPAHLRVDAPTDFGKSIVQGKGYLLNVAGGNSVVDQFVNSMANVDEHLGDPVGGPRMVPGPVFGDLRLIRPRLGQGGFKTLVREAYGKRCAITGHKIVPTLQAAHIVPVSQNGENRVDNGLLLRSDVHTMFDQGYLGVAPDLRLRVSPRLRTEFGNGEEFYSREGTEIAVPLITSDRPNREFLEWHMDSVFLAS